MKPQVIENISALKESAYKSQYFRKALEGTDHVLCLISAAEYQGLCSATTEPRGCLNIFRQQIRDEKRVSFRP